MDICLDQVAPVFTELISLRVDPTLVLQSMLLVVVKVRLLTSLLLVINNSLFCNVQ